MNSNPWVDCRGRSTSRVGAPGIAKGWSWRSERVALALGLALAAALLVGGLGACSGTSQGAGPGDAAQGAAADAESAGGATDGASLPVEGVPDGSGAGHDTATPPGPDASPPVDGASDGATQPADGGGGADGGAGDTSAAADAGGPAPGAPSIVSVDPDTGSATGGEDVAVHGTGFTQETRVLFGESAAPAVTFIDPTLIVATTPPHVPGVVDVTVENPPPDPNGQALRATLADAFLYVSPVEVTGVDPAQGPATGGTPVTITGKGFSEGAKVIFGVRAALGVQVLDDHTILALTPVGEAGPVNVHVATPDAVGTLKDGFTYVAPPVLSSVSPPAGPLSGGGQATLHGTGLAGVLSVRFGEAEALVAQPPAGDELVVTVPPAGAPGPVDVTVTTDQGEATLPGGYVYVGDTTPATDLELLAVTPSAGPVSGGNGVSLVVVGLDVAAQPTVEFGGKVAEVTGVDATHGLVEVTAPPVAVPGSVDVTVAVGDTSSTLADAYLYQPAVSVDSIFPAVGPTGGGTPVTIQGSGFAPGAAVHIGALPAASVVVVDEHTIEAVTPEGSPGVAPVRVTVGDLEGTLDPGFFYQSTGMAIYVVDPALGSVAGGTFIQVIGTGFGGDSTVLVGGNPASHIKVVDSTLITAKTPPGQVGTVDVTVESPGGSVTLPASFTYFNPESALGGTWGQQVEGALNITVKDGSNSQPVPDAFVILGTDPTTEHQGFTNLQGQITFSGPDVKGKQMISASKDGYESNTVVAFDAENITIYLTPIPPPSPASPPGVQVPLVSGRLVGLDKYTLVPIGDCLFKQGSVPAPLCQPCSADVQCGGDALCVKLHPDDFTSYCATPCAQAADCPEGFVCGGLGGKTVCVPTPGEKVARCYGAKPDMFKDDLEKIIGEPGPNGQWEVHGDGDTYTVYAYPGRTAVVCMGGYVDADTGDFVPLTLGVARNVLTSPGEETKDVDIQLNHPMDRDLVVHFSNRPETTAGGEPSIAGLFVYLDLDLDGVFEFKHAQVAQFWSDTLTANHLLRDFVGDLYDASLTLMGGAFSMTDDNQPFSVAVRRNITKFAQDDVYRFEAGAWDAVPTGVVPTVYGMWGASPQDLWLVGEDGLVVHYNGASWTEQPAPAGDTLYAIWGFDDATAYAVGASGRIVHFDGTAWSEVAPSPSSTVLRGVWGPSPDDVWVVGQGVVAHYDGSAWQAPPPSFTLPPGNLYAVHGVDSAHAWMVGASGTIFAWSEQWSKWVPQESGTKAQLEGVWAVNSDDVWAVGAQGTVLHYDGTAWSLVDAPTSQDLHAVWARGADDVWAVGSGGVVLHFDGAAWGDVTPDLEGARTDLFGLWGFAGGPVLTTGAHQLVLGPLVEVPVPVHPLDGETLTDYSVDFDFADGVDASFQLVNLTIPGLMGDTPEWFIITGGWVKHVDLPEFPLIEGTPGIVPGPQKLTIIRAYKPGFDIDNYDYTDFDILTWGGWSVDTVLFVKQ